MKVLKAVRWTVDHAASEFDIDRKTLSKRLKASSIEPGTDGKFGTMQICAAVFGDTEGERRRKLTAEADLLEIDLAKARHEVVETPSVLRMFEEFAAVQRQIVKNSSMSDTEKMEFLKNIRTVSVDDLVKEAAVTEETV